MNKRAELISLTEKEDLDGLLQFMKDRKIEDRDLFDILASCSKRQLEDIWEGIRKMSLVTLLCMDAEDGGESLERCLSVLNSILPLAVCTLNQDQHYIPGPMFEAVVVIHGILTSLPEDEDKLKNNLCKFFEKWWSLNLDGREELAVGTLTYLLEKSVKLEKVSASLISRVWDMREILPVLNLNSESSNKLKGLIQNCFRKTEYMKVSQGRRFLSFVFTLNLDFIETLHQTVKSIMPFSPKSWWDKYGEIYFLAWQRTSGRFREKIEHYCIQDLMSHAVHANRSGSKPMSAILLRVLGYIHKQKRHKQVDEMLFRLYSPILWRSFKVANHTVRANAALLLCDVFPLTDPDSNAADGDALLQKQFDLLLMLLFDPSHAVRVITVQGVCRIMAVYWEMIPVDVIKSFITKLVQDLVHDASSAEVRHMVFKSFIALLDNHLCHPLMKTILPQLGKHIFDVSEIVRVSVMNLLLRVQHIRTIKPLTIVPIDDLLSTLEDDTPAVCRRIVKLLFHSYIVLDEPENVQISRIIHLIELNPAASRVFFLYAVKHMNLQETVNYMVTLCRFVLLIVIKANRNNQEQNEDSLDPIEDNQEEIDCDEEGEGDSEITMKDENILTKILDGLVIMWTSVTDELFKPKNSDLRQQLKKKMSVAVTQMLKAFQTPQAYTAIMMLAANVSPSQVPMLSRSCMSKLRKMSVETSSDAFGVLLEAMCKWGKTDEVLDQVSDWLKLEVTQKRESLQSSSKRGKTVKKNVCFVDPVNPKPKLAVNFLMFLLRHPICQQIVLSAHRKELAQIKTILADVQKVIENIIIGDENPDLVTDVEFLESGFSTYLSLCVLLNDVNNTNTDSVHTLKTLVRWADSVLVPALGVKLENSVTGKQKKHLYDTTLGQSVMLSDEPSQTLSQSKKKILNVTLGSTLLMSADEGASGTKRESVSEKSVFTPAVGRGRKRSTFYDASALSQKIITKLLEFSSNALLVGIGDAEITNSLCNVCIGCLQQDDQLEMLDSVLGCLFQVGEFRYANHIRIHDDSDVTIPHCMGKVFVAMAAYLKQHSTTYEKLFSEVQNTLSEIFNTVIKHRVTDTETLKALTARIVAAVLAELANASKEDYLGEVRAVLTALSPLSALLLSILHKKAISRQIFTQELLSFIKAAPITDIHMVHGCVQLIATLRKTKFSSELLSECVDSLKPLIDSLQSENCDVEVTYRETLTQIRNKLNPECTSNK